jgi:hypothetical protein
MQGRAEVTTIAEIEKTIESLAYGTQAYHEAMAYYLITMARAQWRLADQAHRRDKQVKARTV